MKHVFRKSGRLKIPACLLRLLAAAGCVCMLLTSVYGCADQKLSSAVSSQQNGTAQSGADADTKDVVGGQMTSADSAGTGQNSSEDTQVAVAGTSETEQAAVNFEHDLDSYQPAKMEYNFYFNYKIVHPWWDAVALGMEDAVEQYMEQGIIINYEYLAPKAVSAQYQIDAIESAAGQDYDLIGVDVADVTALTPVINELIDSGVKVMTFSSSDASSEDGCRRLAYVGNTHNYQDGADLTEALCEKLGYKGNVAILVGSEGAPCHEDRASGAMDVLAKYADMNIVDVAYDEDSVDNAYELTKQFLSDHPDLDGIICCNMSNPVGAARAVTEAGKAGEITIVGMDHDQEALHYLKDGTIYALGVQDCYSIGFDTIQIAIKLADGVLPSDETFPEKTEETTTIIYSDGASEMLKVLYGDMD